ncbi:hypothetical protein C8Q79DRAFT_284134 [Trametes meyenii]|nr:hypothetical protein C8Q79DRAFT_284134 [Trametes meyenii]
MQNNPMTRSGGLRDIDFDILEKIFALLCPGGNLGALSLTCKWLREACKPYLFRCIRIGTHTPLELKYLQHLTIWPHARHLIFCGNLWAHRNAKYVDLSGVPFHKLLTWMDFLSSITIDEEWGGCVSWDHLQSLLSLPGLRHFNFQAPPYYDDDVPGCNHEPLSLPPLASLRFSIPDYRLHPRNVAGETDLMARLLQQLPSSLETLAIPLDVAPLSSMAAVEWPRLKELHLKGDHRQDMYNCPPMITVIAHMPRLRSLSLLRAHGHAQDSPRHIVWPVNETGYSLYQELERVTVSYPDPTDKIYSHMPSTLRKLSLRCWPRHYVHQHRHDRKIVEDGLGWMSPIIHSSELYTILHRCQTPKLEELEIEYQEDADDPSLLQTIPNHFPNLTVLTIIRYRGTDTSYVSVSQIALALSGLRSLRVLRIHLDFPGTPHPLSTMMPIKSYGLFKAHEELLKCSAHTLAMSLPSSLRFVCCLLRERWTNSWLPFRIIRKPGLPVNVEFDEDVTDIGDMSMLDDPGPLTDDQCPQYESFPRFEFY